nr:PREDICTED: CD276 antigen homolog isoform X1 [Lepisosteus oculatus]
MFPQLYVLWMHWIVLELAKTAEESSSFTPLRGFTKLRIIQYDMDRSAWLFAVVFIVEFTRVTPSDKLVSMHCQSEHHGKFGQDTKLSCIVNSTSSEVKIAKLLWKKESQGSVLTYDYGKKKAEDPRFELAHQSWGPNNLDVSLLVRNTKISDQGAYSCVVVTDRGFCNGVTTLQVTAAYAQPVMSSIPAENIQEDSTVEIFCNTSGGYPEGRIMWHDQYGTDWTRSAQTKAVLTEDGRYNLTSKYTVLKSSSSSLEYSCSVHNSQQVKEGTQVHHLMFGPNKMEGPSNSTAVAAVFVVVGALAAGILVLFLFRRRRNSGAGDYTAREKC